MLKKLLLTALIMLSALAVSAQRRTDTNITGHVIDKESGEHIAFVPIYVEGTNISTTTNESGHYMLTNLPNQESVTLVAKFIGYELSEKTVSLPKGKTTIVDFELVTSAYVVEDVVVTANRYANNKRQAGTIVNVMGSKTFDNLGAVTAAETFDFTPGLRLEYNCSNCGLPQLRINGLEGQYSQILIDSRSVFGSLAGVYGLEQLPKSMIERIEVIRGGGSALYGSSAIAGIVNIITKEPTVSSFEVSNQSMIMGQYGTDISTSLNASLVSSDHRTGMALFGTIRDRSAMDFNDDGFSEVPTLSSETIGFRGYQKLGNYSKLTAEYHHISEYRRGGDNLDLSPEKTEIAEMLNHKFNAGSLDWTYSKGNNSVSVYSALQGLNRDSYYGADYDPDAYGTASELTVNAGAQWVHNFNPDAVLPATLTVGAEFNLSDLTDITEGYDRYLYQTTRNYAAFAQNEWQNDKWSILVGARLDKHSMLTNPEISPRATVRFSPIDELAIRAGYSRGFRAPQAFDEDLHIEAVGGVVSYIVLDPDLRAEYSNTYNLSLDFYKQVNSWQYNVLVEGFYTRLDDVFALRDGGYDSKGNILWERYNASGAVVAGVNFEARISYLDVLDIQAGFTLQSSNYTEDVEWSEDVDAQSRMFRSPDQYGYLAVTYNPLEWLGLNATANYTGSMLVQHNMEGYEDESDYELDTPNFWDLGFKAIFDLPIKGSLGVELSIGIKNILDQRQQDLDVGSGKDAGYFYGPLIPRSYFAGVRLYF